MSFNPFQTIYIRDDIGVSKKFQRNPETNAMEDVTTKARQYDNQLSPISILVCQHHCKPIVLCFNTVEKRQIQYEYNYDNDRFEEIRCDECIDKGNQLKPGDMMFVVSPPRDDAIRFYVGEDGRVEKKKWLKRSQEFKILPSTAIKNADKIVTHNYTVFPILDTSIRPFYSENSPTLNTRVIVGHNLVTGELGKYIFDPSSHQIFQIEVEDVDYDFDMIRKDLADGGKKILVLSMSAITLNSVAILRNDHCLLEKRQLKPDGTSFVMIPKQVVFNEEQVRKMEWREIPSPVIICGEPKQVNFYKLIADYMIINMDGKFRGEVVTMGDVIASGLAELNLKNSIKAFGPSNVLEAPEESSESSTASEDFEQIDRDSQDSDRSEVDDSYEIMDMDEIDQ